MRRGVTLVEMIVVLVVLGLVGAMSALAVGQLRRPPAFDRNDVWRRARVRAIRTGRAVSVGDDSGRVVRFLPDGRALGEAVDPLTGKPLRASLPPTR